MLIGGFPAGDGDTYADFFDTADGVMAFPGWEPFEGADSADLDDEARTRIAANAIPVPEGVWKGVVRLADDRRYDVPVRAPNSPPTGPGVGSLGEMYANSSERTTCRSQT